MKHIAKLIALALAIGLTVAGPVDASPRTDRSCGFIRCQH